MGKAEIEELRKKFVNYTQRFLDLAQKLSIHLPQLEKIESFEEYSIKLKPELDKLLFALTDLEYVTGKIVETKTIKKHLAKEYSAMLEARFQATKTKKEIEKLIPHS